MNIKKYWYVNRFDLLQICCLLLKPSLTSEQLSKCKINNVFNCIFHFIRLLLTVNVLEQAQNVEQKTHSQIACLISISILFDNDFLERRCLKI